MKQHIGNGFRNKTGDNIEAKGDNVFCENTKQKKYWNHVTINKDFTQKCFFEH